MIRGVVLNRRTGTTELDRAFADYGRAVRRIMQADATVFDVVESRMLATDGDRSVVEVVLRGEAHVRPGAMLYAMWRNSPDRVAAGRSGHGSRRYWTTPIIHSRSRRRTGADDVVLSEVVDLSTHVAGADPMTQPRITPRLFTAAHGQDEADRGVVRLHVTHARERPERAASFLCRLAPGDRLRSWVLPHPHRVPVDTEGIAVVTGSGAAGVFAALRSGASGIRLIWGLGRKRLEPWVERELAGWLDDGGLADLEIVHTPDRVTGHVRERAPEVRRLVERGGWLYVSGHEAMGAAVDGELAQALGEPVRDRLRADLRYIVST